MSALTYTAAETADMLGIGYDFLIKQCRAGKFPHHKLGRLIKFTDDDHRAILAATAVEPTAPDVGGMSRRSAQRLARAS